MPETLGPRNERIEPSGTATFAGHPHPFTEYAPHAKGGLGEVLRANDPSLNRTVAVKRILQKRAKDPESRRRFLVEAEITARLEHPGVVPVYGLYVDEQGGPSYAMRFVEGPTLWDEIQVYYAGAADPIQFRRLLQSFIQVCQTVAYAHTRGVIHRDLKPQNILLGKFGETLVVDWGLAKVIGRSDEIRAESTSEETLVPGSGGSGSDTELGSAVGTPAYMSPEQAAGRWNVIDQRSDVYGLGAVLYTLLTGKAPLEKGDWPEKQQRIQQGDIPPVRKVNSSAPHPLEAICKRAMALRPEQRYPSCEALAAEVEHWLADEPVVAYRETFSTKLSRWTRRNRTLVLAGGMLLSLALIGTTIGLLVLGKKNREVEAERSVAITARRKAEALNRFLIEDLLKQADPANSPVGEAITVRELLDKSAATLKQSRELMQVPEIEAQIQSVVGQAFQNLGASNEAEEHLRRAWELRAKTIGPGHQETLSARNDYVYAVVDRDLVGPKILPLAREAYEACLSSLGERNVETARALGTLGSAVINHGTPEEAEKVLRRSSELLKATVGPDHRLTLDVDNTLAVFLATSGRPQESEPVLRSITERRRQKVRDPDLALAISNQGFNALILGDFRTAEALAKEAVEVGTQSVGATAVGTIQARSLLGYSYEGLERWDDAERAFLSVLADRRKTLSPGTLDVQRSIAFLARLYAKQQRWSESSRYLAELYLAQKPESKQSVDQLAGEFTRALTGDAAPSETEARLCEMRDGVKSPLWVGDWLRAEIDSRYGECLSRQNRFDEAEPILTDAAEKVATSVGPPSWSVQAAHQRVVALYELWKRPEDLETWKAKWESINSKLRSRSAPRESGE